MGRVKTNFTSLAQAVESSIGVLPGSPVWYLLEPNDITDLGASVTKVARSPISKLRQRRKGAVTDLDSSVGFEHDITLDSFIRNIEAFVFAQFIGPLAISSDANAAAASTGSAGYTYTAITGSTVVQNSLVFARGWSNSANNGLKVVGSGSTTAIIKVAGVANETPSAAAHATVEVCGIRGAVGDIQIDSNGDIISTALDFTTLKLTVGQMIHVGGVATANQFATAADIGFARLKTIATNKLSLDKRPNTFVADTGSGKQIDILFGRFLRNVSVDSTDFLERSFTFEVAFPGLQNPSGDMYQYPKGNFANELGLQLPLTDKATIAFNYVGTDTPPPTATRATNASAPVIPTQTAAFGTASDIARLRIQKIDETGITTCFKNITLSIKNGATPEKCLGTLGAVFMNVGNLEVGFDATLLFTDFEVPTAIRNNTTVTFDTVLRNGDGAIGFDIPSLTLEGGDLDLPVNESVLINTTGVAHVDPTLGTSISVSLFPNVPQPA